MTLFSIALNNVFTKNIEFQSDFTSEASRKQTLWIYTQEKCNATHPGLCKGPWKIQSLEKKVSSLVVAWHEGATVTCGKARNSNKTQFIQIHSMEYKLQSASKLNACIYKTNCISLFFLE